jgi:murein tripeptide amidase MpaA
VLTSLAVAGPAYADGRDPIRGYEVQATPANLEKLALAGFDVTEGRNKQTGTVEVFGTARQAAKLEDDGVKTTIVKGTAARTSGARARAAAVVPDGSDAGYAVWRRYDRVPGDGKEQYLELYDRLVQTKPNIVKRLVIGKTELGRDIVALKVTKDAGSRRDGSRPAVLYNAVQHAREWLAGETCRRSLTYFTDRYGSDPQVTRLVDTRELWFVCVSNPDGYEYTFTPGNRLWRKNMADSNKNGIYGETVDGVDPNRNFPTNWGLDEEGASNDPTSETYRGPSAGSEPETKAMRGLWDRVRFAFQKNDHTAAELLLWPSGYQQYTPTADNSIFEALAGVDGKSAIMDEQEQFDPDLSSELYITNGDTLDDGYKTRGILGYTPEGTESHLPNVTGFEFEDDEAQVEKEFQRHRKFTLDLAESAADPGHPKSHLGNTVEDFSVDTFDVSYGDPQAVQVTARRSLDVKLNYRINGGKVSKVETGPFTGGERYYQERGVYMQRLRGEVRGTKPGDKVEVWFTGEADGDHRGSGNREVKSKSFTYTAKEESRDRVLVLADENYSGPSPAQAPGGPHYLSYYTQALDRLGIGYDVYDVDANGLTAPHALGVLSHYDTVVWYTGDDYLTRRPGQPAGTGTARVAVETEVAVRDFLNEGGKLLYTGKNAGRQYAEGFEFRNFGFPEPDEGTGGRDCSAAETEAVDGCIAHNNDFLQYYLGAYIYVGGGNAMDADGNLFPVQGLAGSFAGQSWTFAPDGAPNQDHTATFAVTSSILDPQKFPQYADSQRLASWNRPGAGPFSPNTGQYYMAADAHNRAYKRLRRQEVDLTGKTSGELSFKVSHDLEDQWDFMVVEAREVGTDNWTTLPDKGGLTTQSVGDSCAEGWRTIHPQLDHYQTQAADGTCSPTGTTGAWNASTGSSEGWKDWTVDLGPYAGKKVELAISVITDWGTLGLGTWIDDVKITLDGAIASETSFETDEGGWTAGPPPEGTTNEENGWKRVTEQFQEGPVVGTKDTVFTGFGLEGIKDVAGRAAFLKAAFDHVGPRDRPVQGGGSGR